MGNLLTAQLRAWGGAGETTRGGEALPRMAAAPTEPDGIAGIGRQRRKRDA